jgi:single-stranded DNA-binding protein
MNKTVILGRLGSDATIKTVDSHPEKEIINFSVAHDKKTRAGEVTTWVDCTLWVDKGKNGVLPFLLKGKNVLLEGQIYAEAYVNKENKAIPVLKLTVYELFLV